MIDQFIYFPVPETKVKEIFLRLKPGKIVRLVRVSEGSLRSYLSALLGDYFCTGPPENSEKFVIIQRILSGKVAMNVNAVGASLLSCHIELKFHQHTCSLVTPSARSLIWDLEMTRSINQLEKKSFCLSKKFKALEKKT